MKSINAEEIIFPNEASLHFYGNTKQRDCLISLLSQIVFKKVMADINDF